MPLLVGIHPSVTFNDLTRFSPLRGFVVFFKFPTKKVMFGQVMLLFLILCGAIEIRCLLKIKHCSYFGMARAFANFSAGTASLQAYRKCHC